MKKNRNFQGPNFLPTSRKYFCKTSQRAQNYCLFLVQMHWGGTHPPFYSGFIQCVQQNKKEKQVGRVENAPGISEQRQEYLVASISCDGPDSCVTCSPTPQCTKNVMGASGFLWKGTSQKFLRMFSKQVSRRRDVRHNSRFSPSAQELRRNCVG